MGHSISRYESSSPLLLPAHAKSHQHRQIFKISSHPYPTMNNSSTMLAGQVPKLVNKQFNSPINLYSPQAVQETLDRQTKILANGAIGIDFNQLAKPANLQNSAVLKMLEEEEARKRNGEQPGLKRVTWPPPAGDDDIDFVEQTPVQAKTRGVGEYASYETSPSSGPSPQPHTTLTCSSPQSSTPLSPGGTLRTPLGFQHQQGVPKTWAPVTPPAISPLPAHENTWGSSQSLQPVFKKSDSIAASPRQYHSSQPVFQPPPSVITLRPEPPISQVPAPVYHAQPAATMAPVSGSMRGDMKWPPASVKAQTEAENVARVELAKGPIFRPRRVKKDYSGFFAQHALNSTYPGYRAPPGTQYFTPSYHH